MKDVAAADFVAAYARHLKRSGKVPLPQWVDVVKTATFKELSPYDDDWYYIRCASIARHVYVRGHTAVGGLRKRYGGRASHGNRPQKSAIGSQHIPRHCLKTLEKLGVVEKDPKGGRRLSSLGQRDLDRIAKQVAEKNRR